MVPESQALLDDLPERLALIEAAVYRQAVDAFLASPEFERRLAELLDSETLWAALREDDFQGSARDVIAALREPKP